jgi:hypothetical protein
VPGPVVADIGGWTEIEKIRRDFGRPNASQKSGKFECERPLSTIGTVKKLDENGFAEDISRPCSCFRKRGEPDRQYILSVSNRLDGETLFDSNHGNLCGEVDGLKGAVLTF